jgi:hypothetical protein
VIKRKLFTHYDMSVLASVFVVGVVLTFPSYFFFTPFQAGFNVLSILQFLTMLGWISLIATPLVMFRRDQVVWERSRFYIFSILVSLWTISTVLIKIYNYVNFGDMFADYLWVYKIFIVFEWLLPAFYIWLAADLLDPNEKPTKRPRPVRVMRVIDETVEEQTELDLNRN